MNRNEKYKVIAAQWIDTYHYHGSWFEYEWHMDLESHDGQLKSGNFYTRKEYESLVGETVEHDGFTFKVVQ